MRTFRYLLCVGVCLVAAPCLSRAAEQQSCVDISFPGVLEVYDENPGGYVAINLDDDNHDQSRDRDDTMKTAPEDDLYPVTISRTRVLVGGSIFLTVTSSGTGAVRIWKESYRQNLLCETGGSYGWPVEEIGQGTVVWVEGTMPSTSPRDVLLHVWYESDPYGDDLRLTVIELDIDVDSDNDAGFGVPGNCCDEDRIEDHDDKPGKILGVNDSDTDNDGIPGFADGFDLDPNNPDDDATGSEQFVPVVFRISDAVELEYATLSIGYDASDPAAMSIPQPGQPYVPAGGALRLWTVDASAARTKRSVTEKTPQDTVGFYVPPGTYSGANLEKLGFSDLNKTVVLFAEGVRTSAAGISGSLEVDIPNGAGATSLDAVRVTVTKVDLDVDSDNNNALNAPDRSDLEDQYEDKAGDPDHPGKFVQVNDGDKDNDGIPDFADGFNGSSNSGMDSYETAGEEFTPLVLELPACIDPTKAKIRITYDGSGCVASTPEAGKLRIWNCPGSRPRCPFGIDYYLDGNFVQSGVAYSASAFHISENCPQEILYIEAIRPSDALGDCRIVVEVDPCGNGDFMVMDAVRVTAVQVNMEMDGVYHANKTNQGGFIALNDDDDDENQVEDRLQTWPVPGEDNLVAITINRVLPETLTGTVTLRLSAGSAGGIRIWDNSTRDGGQISLPVNYDTPADLPRTLYVEGYTVSTGVRNYELALEYTRGVQTFSDKIKITVVAVARPVVDANADCDSERVESALVAPSKCKDHFVTVKGQPGDITLLVGICPDTQEVQSKITWTGMTQDSQDGLKATTSRAADGKFPGSVNVSGRTARQLVNWVVWATADQPTPVPYLYPYVDVMGDLTTIQAGYFVRHTISPPEIITNVDHPDLGVFPTVLCPDVPPGDGGVWLRPGSAYDIRYGAKSRWDTSRQLRRRVLNPYNLAFPEYYPPYEDVIPPYFTTYLNYPSHDVCGNDDATDYGNDNDPYTAPNVGELTAEDVPSRFLCHNWSDVNTDPMPVGATLEVRDHMRSFARLLLCGKWYRISEWCLWKVHVKFIMADEGSGVHRWHNNGSYIATDNEDF
jgi:hypothetical protein